MTSKAELGNAAGPVGDPQKELGPKPKVQVVFIGIDHHPISVKRLLSTTFPQDIIDYATSHYGRKILFGERYPNILNTDMFGRPLPDKDKKWPFEFRPEIHKPSIRERLKQSGIKLLRMERELFKSWNNGQFTRALIFMETHSDLLSKETEIREIDIVSQLKRLTKALLRRADGGMIVMLFGAGHEGMIDDLQRKLGEGLPIAYTKISTVSADIPRLRIVRALRNRQFIPYELYAQELFYHIVRRFLIQYPRDLRSDDTFTHHYQDIDDVVTRFVNSFSLEEIRRICEEKQDIGKLLRSHPLTQPIRQWLEF